jgi:hypothetical protein
VVIDGRPGAPHDFVDDPVFSADGAVVAYSTGHRIVAGDRVLGPFDGVTPPALSADGRVVAFGRRSGGRWSVVVGAREEAVDGDVDRVFVSPDGSRYGAVVERARKLVVIVDGRAGDAFDQIETPIIGRTWAYAARDGAEWFVIAGGRRFGPYGDVGPLAFSAESLAFGVRAGREFRWVLTF